MPILAAALLAAMPAVAKPSMPVATFSIVARDPKTGDLGVAVQSHWFSVGSVVTWAEAGVGAVATQSFVEPAYGPKGLALLKQGASPKDALAKLLVEDKQSDVRQVGIVDASGRSASHTGAKCIPGAGSHVGDGYATQANLMLTNEVPDAMAAAFEKAEGPLAERMLAALEAAQGVGGDIRGKQSAAILVVRAKASDKPWTDRLVDLRIEDHPQPLVEMRRLLTLHRAYEMMNRGDEAVAVDKMDEALREYSGAQRMVPDNDEFVFWTAVTLVTNKRTNEAMPLFAKAFRMNPAWMLLVPRLPKVGQLPAEPGLVEKILAVGPKADPTAK
ncbi:MAG TPA: DUF1028 domain-containing protein [Candidatus Polarisedimenticolaceae bacterium]|nr:DUF1028 domain-containing protein [Candidatus Polarisedimenticolaceae bacterium]